LTADRVSASSHPGAATSRPADAVEVGRVLGAWGVKGGIKVRPFSGDPQALFSSKRWFVEAPEVARPGAGLLPPLLRVVQAREHNDTVVAIVQEVADREAALALMGARLFVSRASFPTPDADEFYWVDLVGLSVHNRQGSRLGSVSGLIETGPHCVLRILADDGSGEERLIPFVAAYVDAVDLFGRRIDVDWNVDWEVDL
jgi:16S rRNA processing protein RimM